jgi:hypothetical protein
LVKDISSRLNLESDEDEKSSFGCSVTHGIQHASSRNHTDQPSHPIQPGGKSDHRTLPHKLACHITHDAFLSCARDLGDKPSHGRRSSFDTEDNANTPGIDEEKCAAVLSSSATSLDQVSFLATLTTLTSTPPVIVYSLPVPDIHNACKKAQAKGLYSYIVTDMLIGSSKENNHEHWRVVIGKDRHTVMTLGSALHHITPIKGSKPGTSLSAVAVGAAMFGVLLKI